MLGLTVVIGVIGNDPAIREIVGPPPTEVAGGSIGTVGVEIAEHDKSALIGMPGSCPSQHVNRDGDFSAGGLRLGVHRNDRELESTILGSEASDQRLSRDKVPPDPE